MSAKSEAFEKQIHRIHSLLETQGSLVTWNDRFADPDNPDQIRQVDISIKRSGFTAHIECRSHKSAQDVKWIEELIGRRASLRVDQIIAVSDSGFTAGARRKAESFGIILRDMASITQAEVVNWGASTTITIEYYSISNLKLQPTFIGATPRTNYIGRFFLEHSDVLSAALNASKYVINTLTEKAFPMCVQTEVTPQSAISIAGQRMASIRLRYEAGLIVKDHVLPTVSVYGPPESNVADALIEVTAIPQTEIIKSPMRTAVHLDLSTIPSPDINEMIAGVIHLSNIRCLSLESLHLVGNQEHPVSVSSFDIVVPG